MYYICILVSIDWFHQYAGYRIVKAKDRKEAYWKVRDGLKNYEDVCEVIGPFDEHPRYKIKRGDGYDPERKS